MVEAVGAVAADTMTARATSGPETCVLPEHRTRKGARVEEDHCLPFHGSACDFSGDDRKR